MAAARHAQQHDLGRKRAERDRGHLDLIAAAHFGVRIIVILLGL
jgi:hypothetical protein